MTWAMYGNSNLLLGCWVEGKSEKVAGKESVNDNRAVVEVVFTEASCPVGRVFRSPSGCRMVGSGKDGGKKPVSKEEASTLISWSESMLETSLQDHIT
jgi:hypothetical protein